MFWKIIGGTILSIFACIGIFTFINSRGSHNTNTITVETIQNMSANQIKKTTRDFMKGKYQDFEVNTILNQEQRNMFSLMKNGYINVSNYWYEQYQELDCEHYRYKFYGTCINVQNDIIVFRNAVKNIINSYDTILTENKVTKKSIEEMVDAFKKAKATYPILINDMYGSCNEECKLFIESCDMVIDNGGMLLKYEF